jgi:cell filamentation protein
MIEFIDFTMPSTVALRNKLGITQAAALARATADFTAFRLAELQTAPIRGAFDSVHLQGIHSHVFQDLYEWAGELRDIDAGNIAASHLEKTLNSLFDRLGRENHLKGYSPDEWARSASAYIYDLGLIRPFVAGNGIALREFAAELARKNGLNLQWDATARYCGFRPHEPTQSSRAIREHSADGNAGNGH